MASVWHKTASTAACPRELNSQNIPVAAVHPVTLIEVKEHESHLKVTIAWQLLISITVSGLTSQLKICKDTQVLTSSANMEFVEQIKEINRAQPVTSRVVNEFATQVNVFRFGHVETSRSVNPPPLQFKLIRDMQVETSNVVKELMSHFRSVRMEHPVTSRVSRSPLLPQSRAVKEAADVVTSNDPILHALQFNVVNAEHPVRVRVVRDAFDEQFSVVSEMQLVQSSEVRELVLQSTVASEGRYFSPVRDVRFPVAPNTRLLTVIKSAVARNVGKSPTCAPPESFHVTNSVDGAHETGGAIHCPVGAGLVPSTSVSHVQGQFAPVVL